MREVASEHSYRTLSFALGLLLCACTRPAITAERTDELLRKMVEADWIIQEKKLDRQPHDERAILAALERTGDLLDNLEWAFEAASLAAERKSLRELIAEASRLGSLDERARRDLYVRIRTLTRAAALTNPLLAKRPLVFMKRRRFICQMLHEYLGYYYDYGDIAGGGLYILERPGLSMQLRDLIGGRLPRGNYTTPAVDYDAKTVYFAFAERAAKKPAFGSVEQRHFHIYSVAADGSNLRQLTNGPFDDFDPCPLPDGGIAFMSTRRGGYARCNNPWEPLPSYTLHRMDRSGDNIRTLSVHETSEWHPSVLADGRIVYCRWDYVDRSAANFHGLWVSNPDGTGTDVLFGNYTRRINACFQPKAIPNSNRIAFIAGAHHADVGGSLVVLDPSKHELDERTGQDRFESIEVLTPQICFPEAPGWPKSYVHSPWPLSEDHFLVSFSHDPLPGMSSGVNEDTVTGLYYLDRFGNLELLYSDPDIPCMYPIPLHRRRRPPVVPSNPRADLGSEGEFVVANVYASLSPLPPRRRIQQLRVYQVLPKTHSHIVNQPRIGHANAESARMLLGTVPVESDGSAYFRAPASKPLYFQAVDHHGRAVQSMRSVTYLQPGEQRSCLGCHEPLSEVPRHRRPLLALSRGPSKIQPGPEGTQPLSYPLLVQSVLDGHCVRCHDGQDGSLKSTPVLTGEPAGHFTRSYESLRPYLRWYEWGGATITENVTKPGRIGADESPLLQILTNETHAKHVQLPDDDRQRLVIWLDSNAPFYGTYEPQQQLAQRSGRTIPPPQLQ